MPTRTLSGGVAGMGQLPTFQLPAADGSQIRSWDYKGRRRLVLWLAGPHPDQRALRRAADREPELQAEGAELVVVLRRPRERAAQVSAETGLHGPVLADADGRVHARLNAEQPTLFVVDRNGTIYWSAPVETDGPNFDEALSWLGYIDILEPECGSCTPAWPTE